MTGNNRDYDYTIVLDGNYLETSGHEEKLGKEVKRLKPEDQQTKTPADDSQDEKQTDSKVRVDLLYSTYEKMLFKEPTIMDDDDAYPHSYQWRMGDRYDPGKIEVLEAAVREGKKISDTEAYQKYVEDVTNRKFTPDSWD